MRFAFALLSVLTLVALQAPVASASHAEPWRLDGESASSGGLRLAIDPAGWQPATGEPGAAGDLDRARVACQGPREAVDGLRDALDGPRSWPQATREIVATPVFYDFDGDGSSEIVAADDRYIYVWDASGALLPGWPVQINGTQQHAAVGDLDGDGEAEIAITSNLPVPKLWLFDFFGNTLPGWPVDIPYTQLANLTCPVLANIDGDPEIEVAVAGENGVFFYNPDGSAVAGWPYTWPVPINNPQWSAPAIGDVDEDGDLEVAVGNVCYPNWGVHLIRANGTSMPGWPKVIRPVYSSPALADLDGDGDLEIIAQEGDPGSQGHQLWVWHHDGTVMTGWPRNIAVEGQSSRSGPAVADLEGDGTLEIITLTGDGKLHILHPDGNELPGYPRTTAAAQPISSVSVGDVDDDGTQEIFFTYWASSQQWLTAMNLDGTVLTGFPKNLYNPSDLNSHCSTHIADFDSDGDWDVTTAGSDMNGHGRVYVFEVDGSSVDPEARMDWPKIRRDIENHGCFCGVLDPAAVGEADLSSPAAFSIRVSPNPYLGGPLRLSGLPGNGGKVDILDPAGRLVGSARIADSGRDSGAGEAILPSRRLANGIYLLRFTSEEGRSAFTRLLVLER